MISKEEKKIILRRKPLPKYYVSIKSLFPSVYNFVKRDLIKELKKEDFLVDVIYDYKNDDFWMSEEFFNKTENIYIGYIKNETFESYKGIIVESSKLIEQLYNQYILIRALSLSDLIKYKHKYKKEMDEKHQVIYEYCKYELVSRIFFIKLINRFIYLCKFIPRHKYQNMGKKIIFDKLTSSN